jgi:hypothetical protein
LEGERAGRESPVREESETRRERKKKEKKFESRTAAKRNGSNPYRTTSRKDVLQEVSCRKDGRKKIFDMM